MGQPHPALIEIAAGRPPPSVDNYAALATSAAEHRMTGLVWTAIEKGQLVAPAHVQHQVAMLRLQTVHHNQKLWAATRSVIADLQDEGIDVAVVKGVVAERQWYERLGERPTSDVDIYLPKHQLHRARDLIGAIDATHHVPQELVNLVPRGLLQAITIRGPGGIWIDVHFDLFKLAFPLRQADEIWSRCIDFPLSDALVCRVLDPEISLVHFLVHLNKDRFPYLIGYADIARILATHDVNWEFIDRFLRAEGLEGLVYPALEAVASTLQLPHPGPRYHNWRRKVWTAMWPERIRLQGHIGLLRWRRRSYFFPLLSRGRKREVARWLWHKLFPPKCLLPEVYPEGGGPYLWWIASVRTRRAWKRLLAVRQMRRADRSRNGWTRQRGASAATTLGKLEP